MKMGIGMKKAPHMEGLGWITGAVLLLVTAVVPALFKASA
jgi:hypothetical protein